MYLMSRNLIFISGCIYYVIESWCHAPILQNNIILFDFIPRHYVKFYAKVVIDDSAESRMLNVIMNILIINK